MKSLNIGLIGNPNAGKTTLFNQLTGTHQRVGNWPGVTVERKEGNFTTLGSRVCLTDLPGTYSISTASQDVSLDEQIACHHVFKSVQHQTSDLFINVVDASQLERSLWLTLQLRESGVPCILALNMVDMAEDQSIFIDVPALEKELGCPVVPLVSTQARGIDLLKLAIDNHEQQYSPLHIDYPAPIVQAIESISELISKDHNHIHEGVFASQSQQRKRWLALQTLEGDIYSAATTDEKTQKSIAELRHSLGQDPALIVANARYERITRISAAVINLKQAQPHRLSQQLDRIVLNRWLGVPFFLFMMYLMFLLSINIGGALQPLFDKGSSALFIDGIQWIGAKFHLPDPLTLFLAQGIGGGLNTMLPLVPQIGLMYVFLSFMEDSGYMARAAFVIDKLMQGLGLPGKSFVPLIVGFGCNVPAVMGTRTLNSPRERLMTIMMAPFMSCGARLAIFAVFSAAFFGQRGAFMIFSLYVIGMLMAVLTGLILKNTLMRGKAAPFIMELPSWHTPHLRNLFLQAWQNLRGFVVRAGKVIIIASMFVSLLSSFSFNGKHVNNINESVLASISRGITVLLVPMGVESQNWQATVGLVTGAIAKEVVVGTLNTLYTAETVQSEPFDPASFDLLEELKEAVGETWTSLKDTFSLSVLANPIEASKGDGEMTSSAMGMMSRQFGSDAAAFSYLLFVLLYIPCVSVMGAIARETNRRWMWFSVFFSLNLAYSTATLFWQIVSFKSQPLLSSITMLLVILFNVMVLLILKRVQLTGQTIPITLIDVKGCEGCVKKSGCHS